jgi:hypothetical protein
VHDIHCAVKVIPLVFPSELPVLAFFMLPPAATKPELMPFPILSHSDEPSGFVHFHFVKVLSFFTKGFAGAAQSPSYLQDVDEPEPPVLPFPASDILIVLAVQSLGVADAVLLPVYPVLPVVVYVHAGHLEPS